MSRKPPAPALPAEQLLIAWQSASLLLGYPDEELLGRLDLIRRASERLPAPVGGPLRGDRRPAGVHPARRSSRPTTSRRSTTGAAATSS